MTHTYAEHSLSNQQVERYSRQLLIKELGVEGQSRICGSSVLIVGAGGLGCPVAQYIAAAGVGRIGVVDYDTVELNNLHRQVLHDQANVGLPKAVSLCNAINRQNQSCQTVAHEQQLSAGNALALVTQYDVIVDCSDNAPTRYLVNDACVLAGKPLVSGSALRWDGQLTVYNYDNGPCYRCLYPQPPPAAAVTNCSEGGVLGPVVGVIGSLQAMETLKICAKIPPAFAGHLFVFDGLAGDTRKVRLRGRVPDCAVCGSRPSVTQLADVYESFCGTGACDKVLRLRLVPDAERLTAVECKSALDAGRLATDNVIVDTRPPHEFAIAHLPDAKNIPLADLKSTDRDALLSRLDITPEKTVLCVCHRGNDSQTAVLLLRQKLGADYRVSDILGGLQAYATQADTSFPTY